MMLPGIIFPGALPGGGAAPPVIVQSSVGSDAPASLSAVTVGNLIVALCARNSSNGSGVTISGFPATLSRDSGTDPPTRIRAGLATATSVSADFEASNVINFLVEISGAGAAGLAQAQASGGDAPVNCPSLAGFAANDLVIGFGAISGDFQIGGASAPAGTTLIREEGREDFTESFARAVWKPATAGSNSVPDLMNGGSTTENWAAHTIRIPAA